MTNINNQVDYWDKAAQDKVFTHPINLPLLHKYLPLNSRILDYGCGYGRVCQELAQDGYTNVIGVDSSAEMIQRGRQMNPTLQLEVISSSVRTDSDHLFDAILLIAVLTCIPTDEGQQNLIASSNLSCDQAGSFTSAIIFCKMMREISSDIDCTRRSLEPTGYFDCQKEPFCVIIQQNGSYR